MVSAAFLAGYFFHEHQFQSQPFSLLQEAHAILVNHGLKEIPEKPQLEYGMIQGMLQAYDEPHTIFLEPQQHELASQALEGKFGGIGAQIQQLTKPATGSYSPSQTAQRKLPAFRTATGC